MSTRTIAKSKMIAKDMIDSEDRPVVYVNGYPIPIPVKKEWKNKTNLVLHNMVNISVTSHLC